MRAEDGLWQKADAKAREHHLHRHGRIVAVAGHIRRKAAALALLHQKVVVKGIYFRRHNPVFCQ